MAEPIRGTLIVTVLRGNGLVNKDAGAAGVSDPYVVINATNPHTKKQFVKGLHTKVIDNNLNPVWNEKFSVNVDEDTPSVNIELEVFDKDPVGGDDPMGHLSVNVDGKFPFEAEQSVPLKPRKKE